MTRANDWLLFVGEGWTPYSQRGQSIAIELAAMGERVFFLEPMHSLASLFLSLFRRKRGPVPAPPPQGVVVLRPWVCLWTFRGSPLRVLDRFLFGLWFRWARRRYHLRPDAVLYINMPYWWRNIVTPKGVPHRHLVYDCIDDCRVYARNARIQAVLERSEAVVAREADTVLATARVLAERMQGFGAHPLLVSNGVDTHRFQVEGPVHPCLEGRARPVFGFVGALFYWIDYQVFLDLAAGFPGASIVLVGPQDASVPLADLAQHPNIHLAGPVPFAEVPSLVRGFDVCLNPFRPDAIGDTVNPIKLYEYLALGKPVLCARTQETARFKDHVLLYSDRDELLAQARLALGEGTAGSAARRRLAEENNWTAKVRHLVHLANSPETP